MTETTTLTGRRAWVKVFAISGTAFALLLALLWWAKGGSLPFALAVGYAAGALLATVYYAHHRHRFPHTFVREP